MINLLLYFGLILVSNSGQQKKSQQVELNYKLIQISTRQESSELIDAEYSIEQYLTLLDTNVYYHGKVSKTYFISKGINIGPNLNGTYHISFKNFQHSENPINIKDIDSAKFDSIGLLFSFETYNSIWGEINSDTILLRGTLPWVDSRSENLKFVKIN